MSAILRCLRIVERYQGKGPLWLQAMGQADILIEIEYIIEEMEICNLDNLIRQFDRV